jgi:hypothetical protein
MRGTISGAIDVGASERAALEGSTDTFAREPPPTSARWQSASDRKHPTNNRQRSDRPFRSCHAGTSASACTGYSQGTPGPLSALIQPPTASHPRCRRSLSLHGALCRTRSHFACSSRPTTPSHLRTPSVPTNSLCVSHPPAPSRLSILETHEIRRYIRVLRPRFQFRTGHVCATTVPSCVCACVRSGVRA